ncbi:hypothetical protein HN51_032701 [Arachis hypogaea]
MDNENIEDANLEDRTNVIYDPEFQVGQITSTDLYRPDPIQIPTRVREELENRQHICVTSLSCVAVHQLYLLELISQHRPRQINDDNLERELRRTQLMTQLLESEKCRDVIRMGPEAFRQLCQKLRGTGRVKDSTHHNQFNNVMRNIGMQHYYKITLRLKCGIHDGSWTTEAYANVVKTLSIAIGPHITKNHIKNRMKTLKNHFAEAYDLFHHLSGFAWNPVTRKFEAEEEVWQDFIKEKPQAEKWRKIQIKHYDILKELFGADRATGKGAATSRERIQQLDRDPIDLNDSFENIGFSDIDVNTGHDIPTFSVTLDSPGAPHGQPNQVGGNSTSRGTKRKSPMNDFLEAQYEKVALGITTMADAVKEGSYLSSKLHDVAQRQVESAERQASVAERQVSIAEKQISLIERQVAIAEKGLAIMQQSRPQIYSESDVWNMLTELGLVGSFRMQCYQFLCENEQKKRQVFGIPPEMRLDALFHFMTAAGVRLGDMVLPENIHHYRNPKT